MLAITFVGFQPHYLAGEGMSGRQIDPEFFTLVLVHAIALTGWMVPFLVPAPLVMRELAVGSQHFVAPNASRTQQIPCYCPHSAAD